MHLHTSVWLPLPRPRVFAFFADAGNLQALTPGWLHFRIVTPTPLTMQQGTVIDYRLRIRGIPVGWQSIISRWQPDEVFVDEQRRGPYRRWVHTHRFEASGDGTLVTDHVEFLVPGGRLADWWVARDLRTIFTYRHVALARALRLPPPSPVPEVHITREARFRP